MGCSSGGDLGSRVIYKHFGALHIHFEWHAATLRDSLHASMWQAMKPTVDAAAAAAAAPDTD